MGKIGTRVCEICNQTFTGQGQRFCTKSCRMKWQFTTSFRDSHKERMTSQNPMKLPGPQMVHRVRMAATNRVRWRDEAYRDFRHDLNMKMLMDPNNRFGKRKGQAGYYQGIMMRSSWEREFAGLCDEAGIPWEYEPQVFRLSNGRRYLPDFKLLQEIWVEVKPRCFFQEMDEYIKLMKSGHDIQMNLLSREDFKEFLSRISALRGVG